MTRPVIVVEEEAWYVAQDVLSGVASQGKTIEESINNLKEALSLYFEDAVITETLPRNVLLTTVEVNA